MLSSFIPDEERLITIVELPDHVRADVRGSHDHAEQIGASKRWQSAEATARVQKISGVPMGNVSWLDSGTVLGPLELRACSEIRSRSTSRLVSDEARWRLCA